MDGTPSVLLCPEGASTWGPRLKGEGVSSSLSDCHPTLAKSPLSLPICRTWEPGP